jgi:hypothetical protein
MQVTSNACVGSRVKWFWRAGVLVLGLELASACGLKLYTTQVPLETEASFDNAFFSALPQYSTQKIEEIKASAWDPVLGHTNFAGTSRLLRNQAGSEYQISFDSRAGRTLDFPGPAALSSYGDSFTLGDEVNDHETWQAQLSRRWGKRVENFGVGAYGPDQALLRMRQLRERGIDQAPAVLLTIWSENINRLGVMYYGFYMRGTVGFKPMYRIEGGALQLIPNPLSRFENSGDLERAYQRSKDWDRWFHLRATESPGVPFSWSLLKLAWNSYHNSRTSRAIGEYRDADSMQLLTQIIEEFERFSREYRVTPWVLFVPSHSDLRLFQQRAAVPYQKYLQGLRARQRLGQVRILDALEEDFDAQQFFIKPFEGHASVYGNAVIAQALHTQLSGSVSQ